jgi:hypothetical protein
VQAKWRHIKFLSTSGRRDIFILSGKEPEVVPVKLSVSFKMREGTESQKCSPVQIIGGKKAGVPYEKNNMDDRASGVFVFCGGGGGSSILGCRRASRSGWSRLSH